MLFVIRETFDDIRVQLGRFFDGDDFHQNAINRVVNIIEFVAFCATFLIEH